MKSPATTLVEAPAPLSWMPAVLLKAIVSAAAASVPPIVLLAPVIKRPITLSRLAPAALVPMRSPTTTLLAPEMEIPAVVLAPMMLPAPAVVPPIVLPEALVATPTALPRLALRHSCR